MWGCVVKGSGGQQIPSPHIGLVMDFDRAIRERQAQLMNIWSDFQQALEKALADSDLRLLCFTSVFICEVNTPEFCSPS